MNEEAGNKAVELSDEEMDKVAGGKVAFRAGNGYAACGYNISYEEFKTAVDSGSCCSKMVFPFGVPHKCRHCNYYSLFTEEAVSMLKATGYTIYDSNGGPL